jgi:hypothetical protein
MHAPATAPVAAAATAADQRPDRYVVRPAGVLVELLGAAELGEDELLLRLRELGLITYPSPLLEGLLEDLPEVLVAEALARLDPTDMVLFGQAGRACRAAVVAFGVPQEEEMERGSEDSDDEGTGAGPILLRVEDFVGSVELLAWAKMRGCPWDENICSAAAGDGRLPRVQLGRGDVFRRRSRRTPGCAEVGARAGLPVEHTHDFECHGGRTPARAAVGPGARLSMALENVLIRR